MTNCVIIAENERRFLAQELHDSTTQTLLQINMQIGICQRYLELDQHEDLKRELALLEKQILTASVQLRQLITDLRPPVSKDGTFGSLLDTQIEHHQQRGGPPINVIKPHRVNLSKLQQVAIVRIIQEILLNIRKHAQATHVDLTVEASPARLQITVIDNGIGFDDALLPNPLSDQGGAGIVNMMFRANAIDAELTIKSQPGLGTLVQLTVPL